MLISLHKPTASRLEDFQMELINYAAGIGNWLKHGSIIVCNTYSVLSILIWEHLLCTLKIWYYVLKRLATKKRISNHFCSTLQALSLFTLFSSWLWIWPVLYSSHEATYKREKALFIKVNLPQTCPQIIKFWNTCFKIPTIVLSTNNFTKLFKSWDFEDLCFFRFCSCCALSCASINRDRTATWALLTQYFYC